MTKKDVRLWVQLYHDLLDVPAWRALSPGARLIYIALRRRCICNTKQNTNGKVFISCREAANEIGISKTLAAQTFQELIHYGLIVMTRPGSLGPDGKGKAAHWRLTELGTTEEKATMDYLSWDGTLFKRPQARPPRYPGAPRPPKQNPVQAGGTPCPGMVDIQPAEVSERLDIQPVQAGGTYLDRALQRSLSKDEGLEVEARAGPVRAEPEAEPVASTKPKAKRPRVDRFATGRDWRPRLAIPDLEPRGSFERQLAAAIHKTSS